MAEKVFEGTELSKWHCNTCHENFYTEGVEEAYRCPFCEAESVYNSSNGYIMTRIPPSGIEGNYVLINVI